MGHSNQVREFVITSQGIELLDVAVGATGVLTGSARASLASEQRAESLARQQDLDRKQRQLDRKRGALEAQIEAMRVQLAAEEEDTRAFAEEAQDRAQRLDAVRATRSHGRASAPNGARS